MTQRRIELYAMDCVVRVRYYKRESRIDMLHVLLYCDLGSSASDSRRLSKLLTMTMPGKDGG